MHRVIMDANAGMEVDHEKHRPLPEKVVDNRKANLRVCTTQQNQANRRPNRGCTSAFKGVSLLKREGKWRAQITVDGRNRYLGRFTDEFAAARAYDAAALEHFGEFAHTNRV
jgi:hypothetical protein